MSTGYSKTLTDLKKSKKKKKKKVSNLAFYAQSTITVISGRYRRRRRRRRSRLSKSGHLKHKYITQNGWKMMFGSTGHGALFGNAFAEYLLTNALTARAQRSNQCHHNYISLIETYISQCFLVNSFSCSSIKYCMDFTANPPENNAHLAAIRVARVTGWQTKLCTA